MDDNRLTIERVLYGDDSSLTLYRLSNGEIINVDEAVNYIRQGRLSGVVIGKDERGNLYIKPSGNTNGQLK
jgi:hypothetical protein